MMIFSIMKIVILALYWHFASITGILNLVMSHKTDWYTLMEVKNILLQRSGLLWIL